MYDISPLEEQWEQYNRKRRKPFYLYSLLIIVVMALATGFFYNKEMILTEFNKSRGIEDVSRNHTSVLLDTAIARLAVKEKQKTPIFHDAAKVKKSLPIHNNNPMEPRDVFIEVSDAGSTVSESITQSRKPKKKIHIEVSEISYNAYKEIEERFSEAPDSDDALFLARGYYGKRKFSKAAYWALQTNKINGEIEESWLIFAKAKAKIGKKNEAIRVLTQYVKRSNSAEAKKLLQTLKK